MMLKRFGAFVILVHLMLSLVEGKQPSQDQKPDAAATNRPRSSTDAIRKTVGFIRVMYLEGTQGKEIAGTCFFVFYPDERLGTDRGFAYLVTNRHMAAPGAERGFHFPVLQVFLRLNLRSPELGMESLEGMVLTGSNLHWFFPTDEAVDLAVLPLAPDQRKFDYEIVPTSSLATKDRIQSENIAPGDTVVFAGYFYQFPGQKKIQPIVRQGVLAMMPDEELKTTLQKPGHLYFADAHAFHGNSGSPLFVNAGGLHGNTMTPSSVLLLGVISGYYPEGETFSVPAATVLTGQVHDNSGIATVVPAYELKALLDSREVQGARDAAVANEAKQRPH
jgi:hypothetical protein